MSEIKNGGSFERGSRISHSHIINDEEVKEYLSKCTIPVEAEDVELNPKLRYDIVYPLENSIEYIIAVDAEETTIPVKKSFPSSLITFFQFGSLLVKSSDLEDMRQKPFVSPTDIRKLKDIKREKLILPTKNVSFKKGDDLNTSVRKSIQLFFEKKHSGSSSLLETLFWFLFEEYNLETERHDYPLSHCPHCKTPKLKLEKSKINLKTFTWICPHPTCNEEILLTDIFRLFEKADNNTGAEGIISYTSSLVESFLIIHTIKSLMEIEANLVDRFLFIKDGPLSFNGETAGMHKPMQALINYLCKTNRINIVGVENSGPFVDHAKQIKDKLNTGEVLLLSNSHIYKYIIPGKANSQYASTSYYSGKFIYKSHDDRLYVLTIPVEDHNKYYAVPELSDLKNIHEILLNIDKLKCDIYENALIPVALANKLISLTNHPSTNILEKFAKKLMGR
jgi:hypothetical protein